MTNSVVVGFIAVIALGVGLFLGISSQKETSLGSIIQGQEYFSTSTAANSVYGAQTNDDKLLRTGSGSLGSVIVTGANTGAINFYNATTTDVTKRSASQATSTILIASLPPSLTAGTYVFDAEYSVGLYMDLVSGTMPTTTVTWR